MQATDFVVTKDDLEQCRVIERRLPDADALPGEALLVKIDRFAFTANNITYAMLGEQMKYWQLFPAPKGFGNIPVWGFGEVIASKHPAVPEGERLFGYLPMATHLVVEACDVSKRGLRDAAAHRQGVAPVYNAYARVTDDPAYAGRQGDYQALLRPIFMLSFLVDDFLAEKQFFGAHSVILSSASSKAAFGLAHLLRSLRRDIHVIGLTSLGNLDFRPLARLLPRCHHLRPRLRAGHACAGGFCRHRRQCRFARAAAPAFWQPTEIFGPHRTDASKRRGR
jgi:hypothetical protein